MNKLISILAFILLLATGLVAWLLFGSATAFNGDKKYLYIPSDAATKQTVRELIQKDSLIKHIRTFSWLAEKMDYWQHIKPGKYRIESGDNIIHILRMLRNGNQEPVNLIITKLRTKEDLASMIGKKFECDSTSFMQFFLNKDTLHQYGLDSNTVMSAVLPDTYIYFWNTTPSKIFEKIHRQYKTFWTDARRALATERGLTPQSAYALASIVEEETVKNDEKGKIASVYLNRLQKGMPLGADPTVKYALRDFTLKRIYQKHLQVISPYNTYKVTGLPPGPICTPSTTTIDAVLHSPKTEYIYFVAKADFSGYHRFAVSYEDHLKYAKEYREALDKRGF